MNRSKFQLYLTVLNYFLFNEPFKKQLFRYKTHKTVASSIYYHWLSMPSVGANNDQRDATDKL